MKKTIPLVIGLGTLSVVALGGIKYNEVKAAFAFMKDDFSSHLNELDSIQPNINEFLRTTTVAMKQDFPEADIIVEYIIDYYAEVEFFFKKDKDSVIFIGLKEYAGFGL